MSFVNYQPAADLLAASQQILKDWEAGKNLSTACQALAKAVKVAEGEIASAEDFSSIIEAAREQYLNSSCDIEIDDTPLISDTDDGTWVSAWVWVRKETISCEHCDQEVNEDDAIEGKFCSPACAEAHESKEGE